MTPMLKLFPFAVVSPLVLAGCISTNPQPAFDDVGRHVTARTGHEVRWMLDDAERAEIESAVTALLQTNLTAQSCVGIALLNNRTLQAEFESLGISQAELAQATRLKNPEFVGTWKMPVSAIPGVNAEYALAQNFLDLIMLPARKKIATQNLESTKLRVAHEVLKLSEEVQRAFFTAQAQQQFVERLRIIVEINEAAADLAVRQHDAGNINDLELLNQKAAYDESKLDLAMSEAQVRSNRERLNRLLGLWGTQTAWQITDALPSLPEEEVPLEHLEAIAVNQRLDLAAARGEGIAIAGALKLKKDFRYLPGVSIGVDAERDLDRSWLVGPSLALEIPLFDQGQGQIAHLAAEYRRAQRHFEALAVNIRSEVREARDTLIAARDVADYHQKVLLPQRQRILREMLLQYNAMQKSSYDLLLAKEREQHEEKAAIEALRDYWIARAELERAVGGSLTLNVSPMTSPTTTTGAEMSQHEHQH
jgi:cobalt-zinc-cadmium efflux system outer membrane protein